MTTNNTLIHKDRRLGEAASSWVRSFSCEDIKPLIVCRGPIRKEAIDVFREMGMTHVGILLSEKDSIVYPHALAPELRDVPTENVHAVPDYTGASKEERVARIQQIIQIAKDGGYNAIFAGYGFMAEDETFVAAIEASGLSFMGPCAHTVESAGHKDVAKRTALKEGVSVTPGVDNLTARLLLSKYPDASALEGVVKTHELDVPADLFGRDLPAEDLAEAILDAGYEKGIDLYTIDELGQQVEKEITALFTAHPGRRVRLKAIGGGGGKGQRILSGAEAGDNFEARVKKAAALAPEKAREVLAEVKTTGVGDNKNMLLELNIESTRHNEIQLLGNGRWCIALGGRDCSLQMHEQKLLEVSITQESILAASEKARSAGRTEEADVLQSDLGVLQRMEAEGERFGEAVKLDSASTFECIVEGDRHYFMEVNTRIQVEHRVTELCYRLRFTNPEDPEDHFDVDSLVEAMALLSLHKERLPKPARLPRFGASVEARLNATDASLSPHAGGVILSWSDPLPYEVRDDQGICTKNPDTGLFMRYKLAGAYDSNVALLVTPGDDRAHSYDRLAEILRTSKIRGLDLATNLEFHYGLVNWFRGRHVLAKPSTRFIMPYLTQVGLLKEAVHNLDINYAWKSLEARYQKDAPADVKEAQKSIFTKKATLVKRALVSLFKDPHVLSGWLSLSKDRYALENGQLVWRDNPVNVLWDTYRYLNMEPWDGAAAAYVMWADDVQLIETALGFYERLEARTGISDFRALDTQLAQETPPTGFDEPTWSAVRAAHKGHQMGLELLGLAPLIGEDTGFFELKVQDNLDCHIPERLFDTELQARMKKVLAPPPATRADEIVAVSGGMFYAQEGPGHPPFIQKGEHFEAGQPLYIIEVMKMFNRVPAPFAGTVDEVLIPNGDGVIVAKGQTLFKVTPDERIEEEDPNAVAARRRSQTGRALERLS